MNDSEILRPGSAHAVSDQVAAARTKAPLSDGVARAGALRAGDPLASPAELQASEAGQATSADQN